MKRSVCLFLLALTSFLSFGQAPVTIPPDKVYGKLFIDVQMNKVFADGKTFVDCIPKRRPAEIVADYETAKTASGFDLKKFVEENFELPAGAADNYKTNNTEDVVTHIRNLWAVLKRNPAGEARLYSIRFLGFRLFGCVFIRYSPSRRLRGEANTLALSKGI